MDTHEIASHFNPTAAHEPAPSSDRKLFHLSLALLVVFVGILGVQTLQLRKLGGLVARGGATSVSAAAPGASSAASLLQGLQSQVGGCGG